MDWRLLHNSFLQNTSSTDSIPVLCSSNLFPKPETKEAPQMHLSVSRDIIQKYMEQKKPD